MVNNNSLQNLSKEEKDAIRNNRIALKNMWTSSEEAIEQFLKMAKGAKLFDKIDSADAESIGARNLLVDMCDAMGFFDEEFLKKTLQALRVFPEIPTTT